MEISEGATIRATSDLLNMSDGSVAVKSGTMGKVIEVLQYHISCNKINFDGYGEAYVEDQYLEVVDAQESQLKLEFMEE